MGRNRKKDIESSVKTLISELEARVGLLKDSVLSFDSNEKNYGILINLIDVYTPVAPSKLIEEDIFYFDKTDLERMMELSGVDKETIKEMMKSYKKYLDDYNFSSSKVRLAEATEYFRKILKYIKDFINDYESKSDSLLAFQEETIAKYEKYIDLFKMAEFETKFTDTDELGKILRETGMSEIDQCHIYEFVIDNNIKCQKRLVDDIDLDNKINLLSKNYLTEDNIAYEKTIDSVNEIPPTEIIDIDLIPSLAYGISEAHNLDKELVQNTIAALIINSFYQTYKNIKDEKAKKKYMETIADLLALIQEIPYEIETIARDIVKKNEDIYAYYVNEEHIDPTSLIEANLLQIKETYGVTDNTAIDIKKIAILKIMSDILDKIDTQPKAEVYDKECHILKECVGQIYYYENKKENSSTIRIK